MCMRVCLVAWLILVGGCGPNSAEPVFDQHDAGTATDGPRDAALHLDAPRVSDGGAVMTCYPDQTDLEGCACEQAGTTRPCYPASADPITENIGACKDGTQTCTGAGEFPAWGPCTGAITPVAENCTNGIDDNCNAQLDCVDPTCASDPACNTGCTDGQTRACYDGPPNTMNVGTCRAGTQTCSGGYWPTTCTGEVLPTTEDCADAKDHNCNHLPGCLDVFACALSPACQQQCASPLDPGCGCPSGSGDTATCPEGMFGVTKGGTITSPGTIECCPCTVSDCSNAGCCGETVCAGDPACSGLTCKPLPDSCHGQVNLDCDDFPEDCDEPCCKCSNCP